MLALYALAEHVRDPEEGLPTAFAMEQPEDPKNYRSESDVAKYEFMSMWRTSEWASFATKFGMQLVSFDQGVLGHPKRKPTSLGTNVPDLQEIDGLRGGGLCPGRDDSVVPKTMHERCQESKSWAAWAPGLKKVLAVVINKWIDRLNVDTPKGHVKKLTPWSREQWHRHFLQDHLPARRDCKFCVQAQARSRAHKRVTHAEAFTLAVDLSGKMTEGFDQCTQGTRKARYLMVGVYTFPTTTKGVPLVAHPDQEDPQDQPLPPLEAVFDDNEGVDPMTEDRDDCGGVDGEDGSRGSRADDNPLPEEEVPEVEVPHGVEEAAKSSFGSWNKLIEDAKDVQVRNLTLVEPLESRATHHVLAALAKMYGRLRCLGLPVYRLHSDRARELLSNSIRRWTLDRGMITTLTSGSTYKQNGRAESEVNNVKRGVRTLISADRCELEQWPLAARQVGERRLRSQLQQLGWPTGEMLPFGTRAYAFRKSWQDRYNDWRETRELVTVLGPDASSSLTTTCYYVKAVASGRYFYTDDVVQVDPQTLDRALADDQLVHLPIRDSEPHRHGWGDAPTRRLRGKQGLPQLAMLNIAGEKKGCGIVEMCQGEDVADSDGDSSWTLGTKDSEASWTIYQEEDERLGGGDMEGAPNNRDGGSCPVASPGFADPLSDPLNVLRYQHENLHHFIQDELERIDGTQLEQAWSMEAVNEAIMKKAHIEDTLLDHMRTEDAPTELVNQEVEEFNITKTISNKEVWENLESWRPSVEKEYNQLVVNKKAVKQMKRQDLNKLAAERQLPIELLPGKAVHVRKAGTGTFKTRAVVCGNYASQDGLEHFASGSDAVLVRSLIRCAAMKRWSLAGTDIGVAFLNAPKRDKTKLTAMEVPSIFKRCGLADQDDVWLIEMAVYGLTTSPRDWSLHRDETLPSIKWQRQGPHGPVEGYFKQTKDENLWLLCEVCKTTGTTTWAGLMAVYVDDLLLAGEQSTIDAALGAVSKVWTMSPTEWASADHVLKYCGFEIMADPKGDGFRVSQDMYQNELLQEWNIQESTLFPDFKVSEEDNVKEENPDHSMVRQAQALAGSLLWLSTRTRPDLAFGVATMSRLTTCNPNKAVQIGLALLRYVKGRPGGMHYPQGIPHGDWGARGQLKDKRDGRTLEVFADIAYAAGSNHRSIQGFVIYHAGVPVAWQCSQQPFAAHSTAESELISYCEGLLIGKATEALLMEMWQHDLGEVGLNNVLYGDNEAALGLGRGVANCSWRTRHLRIRGSVLRESMHENHRGPGQGWKILHLRGTELVADGITKPLRYQAFDRFLQDLGIEHEPKPEKQVRVVENRNGDHRTAHLAMVVGSTLIAGAGAIDEDESNDTVDYINLCGLSLMMVGAVWIAYMGAQSVSGCLRRMGQVSNLNQDDVIVVDEDSDEDVDDGSTSMTTWSRSDMAQHGSAASSKSMCSQSGMRLESSASTMGMSSQSGCAERRGTTSLPMSSQSGGADRQEATSLTKGTQSGDAGDDGCSSTGMTSQSGVVTKGSSTTKNLHMRSQRSKASNDRPEPVGEDTQDDRSSRGERKKNEWNEFQKGFKGRGLNSTTLAAMYHTSKGT
eukprot:Skav208236  [mRNA]  locus=scaffold2601:200137:204873:+ [translate_table: standard]